MNNENSKQMRKWTHEYKKHSEFKVSKWARTPLTTGAWAGVNPVDKSKIEEFVSHIYVELSQYQPLLWVCYEQEPHLAKCDVSGLHDMVYNITLYILKPIPQTQEA